MAQLVGIKWVGGKVADKLYSRGIKTLDDFVDEKNIVNVKSVMKTKYIDKVGFVDKVVFDRFSRTDIACSIKVV
jgi:hypothetical protein